MKNDYYGDGGYDGNGNGYGYGDNGFDDNGFDGNGYGNGDTGDVSEPDSTPKTEVARED